MSSPFSKSFLNKRSGLFTEASTPLEGNAFIKAKIDAEEAGKDSFVVDGKSHPVQMHGKVQDKIDKARKKFVRKGEEGLNFPIMDKVGNISIFADKDIADLERIYHQPDYEEPLIVNEIGSQK